MWTVILEKAIFSGRTQHSAAGAHWPVWSSERSHLKICFLSDLKPHVIMVKPLTQKGWCGTLEGFFFVLLQYLVLCQELCTHFVQEVEIVRFCCSGYFSTVSCFKIKAALKKKRKKDRQTLTQQHCYQQSHAKDFNKKSGAFSGVVWEESLPPRRAMTQSQ